MSWTEFGTESALERDSLQRALPLVPTTSDSSSRATIDLAANTAQVAISVGETLGATPTSCVELLRLRPLLVGAAWKVLDLLLETALDESGFQPDARRGYTITTKVRHAAAADGRPNAIDAQEWRALTKAYVETAELRHSLVHRRVHTDEANALVGVDESGSPLRPLTPDEQEAFVRAILRAADLVTAPAPDERVKADLLRQLGFLQGLHGQQLAKVELRDALPEIVVIMDAEAQAGAGYSLDVPALRARQPFGETIYADLVLQFRDRPGQDLRGRLERAPSEIVTIHPDNPPAWLH